MCQKLCDTIGSYLVHVTLESKHLEQLLLQFDEWRKTSKAISVLSSVYDFLLTPIFQKSTLLSNQAGPNFMDLYIMVAWNLNETCVCLQSWLYIGSRVSDGPIKTTLENFRNLSIQNWELRFLICCWDSKVRSGLFRLFSNFQKFTIINNWWW